MSLLISSQCVTQDSNAQRFYQDVIDGLSQSPKRLPSKYFYDSRGSRYFDEICQLDEYYPYQTEMSMLPEVAQGLSQIIDKERDLIEFGAGSLVKARILLKHLESIQYFFPIDIAGEHLRLSCEALQDECRHLSVMPVEADFTHPVELPPLTSNPKLGFFPGSTIGNFAPAEAIGFLKSARKTLGREALLLIGVDTKKHPDILHRAYNDRAGITGQFNRNILHHINRKVGANFIPEKFDHYAYYNPNKGCIEMHLISQTSQTVSVDGNNFHFSTGESIHTENSHKYAPEEFRQLANQAGWQVFRQWIHEKTMFGIYLLAG